MYLINKNRVLKLIGLVCVTVFILAACPEDAPKTGKNTTSVPSIKNWDVTLSEVNTVGLSWDPVDNADYYDVSHAGSRIGKYEYLDTIWPESGRITFEHSDSLHAPNGPNEKKYENYYKIQAFGAEDKMIAESIVSLEMKIFGPTVLIYDAKYDAPADILREINRIHDTEMRGGVQQGDGRIGEFSSRRYTFFFKPGEYNIAGTLNIGFYTTIAGLGALPSQTKLVGTSISTPAHLEGNNATCTFWRSIENFELTGGSQFNWGVSQSAPIRRMLVRIPTTYHYNNGNCSGGYTADSYFTTTVNPGSQQQWYTRNCHFTVQMGGTNWNTVIQGSSGQVAAHNSTGAQTTVSTSPLIREKPFLFYTPEGEYKVFVPAFRTGAVGVSWNSGNMAGMPANPGNRLDGMTAGEGMGPGQIIDFIDNFYITKTEVRPQASTIHAVGLDKAASINEKIAEGKHIYVTPGRYEIESPIIINKPNTIVLGHGFPTVYPTDGNSDGLVFIGDVDNVTLAGLMFDAGSKTAYLLAAGETGSNIVHPNPTLISDLCLRVGGYSNKDVHADVSVLINSNNLIGDKLWVWRSDHGVGGLIDWHYNTSKNGIVVIGDDVEMYGLFVEHHHEYSTLWMGERGRMYFYQNETPYDPHYQNQWSSHGGTVNGYAQYKVDHRVTDHQAWGLGVYAVFLTRANGTKEPMYLYNGIEVPNAPNVIVEKAVTVNISNANNGGITTVINGNGAPVENAFGTSRILSHKNGETEIMTETGSVQKLPSTNPAPETHWVEELRIDNQGKVTANPNGGLPPFASRNKSQ